MNVRFSCMGFSDFARRSIKQNRLLRQSRRITLKFTKSHYSPVVNPKVYQDAIQRAIVVSQNSDKLNDERRNSKAKWKRSVNGAKFLLLTTLLVVIFSFLLFRILDDGVSLYSSNYRLRKESMVKEKAIEIDRDAYRFYVSKGDSAFRNGQVEHAQSAYLLAKNFIDSGKAANFGLASCLITRCRTLNKDCDIADDYYEALMSSDILSLSETEILIEFRH